jgi:hypothetical protein
MASLPVINLFNGSSLHCNALPEVYPCVTDEFACWNSSSNCFGFFIDVVNNSIADLIPNRYVRSLISQLPFEAMTDISSVITPFAQSGLGDRVSSSTFRTFQATRSTWPSSPFFSCFKSGSPSAGEHGDFSSEWSSVSGSRLWVTLVG